MIGTSDDLRWGARGRLGEVPRKGTPWLWRALDADELEAAHLLIGAELGELARGSRG